MLRAAIGTTGLIGALCAANAARAQTSTDAQANASAPADHILITKGGVDLRSGAYNFSQTDVSIGEGSNSLSLTRLPRKGSQQHVLPFANFTHNWDMYIVEKRVDILKGNYNTGSGLDYRMMVYVGDGAEAFDGQASGTAFQGTSKGAVSWLTYSGDRSTGTAVYTLRKTDGTLVIFRPINSADCATYVRCAYVSQISQPDGTNLNFEYDQNTGGGANSARLRSISSNRGGALLFEYAGSAISKVCAINLAITSKPSGNVCPAGARASAYSYGYSSGTVLTSVTDPVNNTWAYTYGGSGASKTIGFVKPGNSTPYLVNTYGDFISEDDVHNITYGQQFADGEAFSYAYTDTASQTNGTINQIAGGVVTDAQGHTISALYGFPLFPRELTPGYNSGNEDVEPTPGDPGDPSGSGFTRIYQVTSGPVSVTDELGHTTTYDYCDPAIAASLPSSATDRCVVLRLRNYTDPEGGKTDVTFGSNGLITQAVRHPKPGSPLANITLSTGYSCISTPNQCAKPTFVIDANGNVTNMSYTSFGALEWAIQPPPASGAARALKLYSYTQKYAFVMSSGGSLVAADSPVWMLATETVCQTVAGTGTGRPSSTPTCDPAAPVRVTTYEYAPDGTANNLWLRGVSVTADGTTLRTCYGYDAQGNRIWETKPKAGLSACY